MTSVSYKFKFHSKKQANVGLFPFLFKRFGNDLDFIQINQVLKTHSNSSAFKLRTIQFYRGVETH